MLIVTFLLGAIVILVIYRLLRRPYTYWTERGVQQGNPVILFGDKLPIFTRQESLADLTTRLYNLDPNSRYVGLYDVRTPTLILKDPELIKQVAVKDHDSFMDHKSFVPEGSDPILGNMLLLLKGQKWKDVRTTLSPAYTSSKMKQMFLSMCENAEQFVEYFSQMKDEIVTVELKDTFGRFTSDVIANTVFGVRCNSLENRDDVFYKMGQEFTNFKRITFAIKLIASFLFPRMFKFFKLKVFSTKVSGFFDALVKENLQAREKNNIVRPDILYLLNEQRKNQLKYEESKESITTEAPLDSKVGKVEITEEDISAQALIFFFAGFDSVSSLMCWMAFELALNPEIQQKLRLEIEKAAEECDGQITYEALVKLKYLDMVISETLRKWPPFQAIDRMCTKDFVIKPEKPEEQSISFAKDQDRVLLPIWAIQRDPKYYPDPLRFDPERFSDENKDKIVPYSYIPFGAGPRNCIGSRFALLETKILFYYLLLNFEIIPVEKTNLAFKMSPTSINTTAEGGYWFGLKQLSR